jgi:hypothetical protein
MVCARLQGFFARVPQRIHANQIYQRKSNGQIPDEEPKVLEDEHSKKRGWKFVTG